VNIKRYDTECGYGCSHGSYELDDGPWVKWEDYAALQAEVERLKTHSFTAEELASMKAEAEFLHAQFKRDLFNQVMEENEMLRKAGDAMAKTIGENGVHDNGSFHDVADSIDQWHTAKEGKPSV